MKPALITSIVLVFFFLISCNEAPPKKLYTAKQLKEKLIEHNQKKVRTEDDIIDSFVADNYPDAKISETGLRYVIYPAENKSELKPNKSAIVIIDYTIELLNGRVLYSTKKKGFPEKFRVEHEDAPAGLHQGLQMMHTGDSAVFIMPSHLAYGFTGDQQAIGKNAILIYKVVLIEIE